MKDILTSPRMESLKRKRKIRRRRITILCLILAVVCIGGIAYVSGNSRVTIHSVRVTGTRIINASDIEWSVKDAIAGKYLHLFSKSNILIYPHDSVYEKLLSDFPRISKLSINREGLNTLSITIAERSGSYLYCGARIPEIQSEIGENCYFINNDGYVFDKAPYFSGTVYFKYYIPLPDGVDTPLGAQVLPPEKFHALARFIDRVIALGFKPTYLVMNSGDNVLYLDHGDADTSPVIMFENEDNLDKILENLSLSMSKSEFADDIHSKYTSLLYIDLRFNNKVLYKFQ